MHLRPWPVFTAVALIAAFCLAGAAWGQVRTGGGDPSAGIAGVSDRSARYAGGELAQFKGRQKPNFETFPPEERPRMQQQFREWQSLPPEQKDTMRRRMDDWNRLPPTERDRYQQRYQQWQRLSPDERRQMENNLQRWDRLSPQERDSLRQRFRQ